MRSWKNIFVAAILLLKPVAGIGQALPAVPSAASVSADPAVITAGDLIGKALFLRGFYAANGLSYDAAGRLEGEANGSGQPVDWTLSGVNILKVERVGSGDAVELDGVRVAIRYNPDAHEFQRHPLNDQKMTFVVKLAPNAQATKEEARQLRAAFAAMFASGIDPGIEHSVPPLWSHSFDPSLAWPPDALSGQTIYAFPPPAGQPQDLTAPLLAHRADPRFTDAAAHDKVAGQVQLRVVIDPEGVPQHIVVARPLGYGLDEQAAEAVAKWRFEPAMRAGKPVAAAIGVSIDFQAAPPR